MFIELHILQNFAPSNLNRDDTNSPKDCYFGGFRRARISSQCVKRAVRKHPSFEQAVAHAKGDVGVRTKRLAAELVNLMRNAGRSEESLEQVARNLITGARLKLEKEGKTQYLLYLGRRDIAELAAIGNAHWDALTAIAPEAQPDEQTKKKTGSKAKKAAQANIPKVVIDAIKAEMSGTHAADIALFGRMVADDKEMNVDAACQVAHALSTNEVRMEDDYYTAIDDLLPGEETGSDMIGTVMFNSSCFYRYSQINLEILRKTLGDDPSLVAGAIEGFLRASVLAIPTGKQNSMAAQNPPSYVRVLVRSEGAPWSLANAFVQPVRSGKDEGEDLVSRSAAKLDSYFEALKGMYGSTGIDGDFISAIVPLPEGREALPLDETIASVRRMIGAREPADA